MLEPVMNSQVCDTDVDKKFGLDSFKVNWFTERGNLAANHSLSIEVKNVLHRAKSEHQDILVFDSKKFGRCLAVDNRLQYTEAHGFAYQEMMAFLPMNSHPDPRKVLIIGSGNGGILEQVEKFLTVESIVLCEIDKVLIDVTKKYFPVQAKAFQSPKLTIRTEDGMEYLKKTKDKFDVIIMDTRNPLVCRNVNLKLLKPALKPAGVVAFQVKCYWFDTHQVKEVFDLCRSYFPKVQYASVSVPTYPGGQVGVTLCGISAITNFKEPIHKYSSKTLKTLKLRYYTPDVHRAAFVLPVFMKLQLPDEVYPS